jgi:hypothetical protein
VERQPARTTELTVDRLLARLAALEAEHARLQRDYQRLGAQLRSELARGPGSSPADRLLGQEYAASALPATQPEAWAQP